MWMHRESGYLVLELEKKQKDVLLSLEIATWLKDQLDEHARINILNNKISNVGIEVQAIENQKRGQVRLVFGRALQQVLISPAHAIKLSGIIGQAVSAAERYVRWKEERDPQILMA